MRACERRFIGTDHRPWACARAEGRTLEVAVGTGLNLPHYPPGIELTAIDFSPGTLELARERVLEAGLGVELLVDDAQNLSFPDESFDSVVCTFSLCNIPDERRAVQEMKRVLRPGGRLVLVDHIRSSSRVVRGIQHVIEFFSKRIDGDHMLRRPLEHVIAEGFEIEERHRMKLGIIERVGARKPA